MTITDLPVTYRNIQDETMPQTDGTVIKYKRYDFTIGKFGPFTERVKLEGFNDQEIATRIAALRLHLLNLPT